MFIYVIIIRTISHILSVIFEDPEKCLKQVEDSTGYLLQLSNNDEFKIFLLSVQKENNYFASQIGTYKQVSGVLI